MNFWYLLGIGALLLVLGANGLLGCSTKDDPEWGRIAQSDLFVEDPKNGDLLHEWRWKVGSEAQVFRVTVFGDVFTQTPAGRIYWLDTGTGNYVEVAKNAEQWADRLKTHGFEWFHWQTFSELRDLKVELAPGKVFSWQKFPMYGGQETAANVDWVPTWAHLTASGRSARSLHDRAAGRPEPKAEEDTTRYNVVINDELQYSIWPVDRELPTGWKSTGKSGLKEECLDYIKEVWTDMRPLSLRKKLEETQEKP